MTSKTDTLMESVKPVLRRFFWLKAKATIMISTGIQSWIFETLATGSSFAGLFHFFEFETCFSIEGATDIIAFKFLDIQVVAIRLSKLLCDVTDLSDILSNHFLMATLRVVYVIISTIPSRSRQKLAGLRNATFAVTVD